MAAEETPKEEEKGIGKGKSTYTSGQQPIEEPKEEKKEIPDSEKTAMEIQKETKRKERTKKQVDKLTKSNQELKKERDQYRSVIDSLKPKTPPPPPQMTQSVPSAEQFKGLKQEEIDDTFSGMMDEEGYVDGNKLMGLLKQMNERAVRAEHKAQAAEQRAEQTLRDQRDFEESREVREVHKKYPKIDPNSEEFDEELFDSVRNEMIGQMMQGKSNFMEATEKWYNRLHKEEEVATKKEKTEQAEKEDAKAQINATQPKSSSMTGYYRDFELEQLKKDTITGKKGALAERLRRSGHGPA